MNRVGTRGETAFLDIRRDILAGRLLPGERLQFSALSSRYEASVGVLREALSRLAEQGLVISEPQQGYSVAPVSIEDLQDLTAARIEIETAALRRSLAAGDLVWESRLVAAHHLLDRTPQLSDDDPRMVREDWSAAHARFHEVLLEACQSRRLRDIATALRDTSELYRRWSRYLRTEEDRDIPGEHELMLRAALDRDVEGAVKLLAQHIEYTTNALIAAGKLAADSESAPADGGTARPRARKQAADGQTRRARPSASR
jgi:DNA-binding GntR family transcriptional regulator